MLFANNALKAKVNTMGGSGSAYSFSFPWEITEAGTYNVIVTALTNAGGPDGTAEYEKKVVEVRLRNNYC
ncbi:hypothetical protein [Serpentinicella alkaliphila]|uniref:Uncharacterized protein n=1 Tax=Serpentinicella alkaliphila TaxID=1734049 RepID=A0A4R2UH29_9FIRM|nr:hypothetical protein [Serpentinicella alkaliphila]QUH25251.1 hypothetical protein HZR23_05385 [Serpentinicella alkaliphila]TCQ07063.1 hypothetical protein EDD79_100259 [Serpentinicella alkaliphila]